jgi:hypothetical protein
MMGDHRTKTSASIPLEASGKQVIIARYKHPLLPSGQKKSEAKSDTVSPRLACASLNLNAGKVKHPIIDD